MTKAKSKASEYYVAFSIHGSYCFITANIVPDRVTESGSKVSIGDFSFTRGRSRDGSNLRGAQKLLSDALLDGKKKPLTNARDIHAFFMRLRDAGWTVDDKAFIAKHGLTAIAAPKPAENNAEFHAETPPAVDFVAAGMASASVFLNDVYAKQEPDLKDAVTEETFTLKASSEKPAFENLDGSIHGLLGDITKVEADAIINAANAQLIPGGGVDGAINKAAGPELAKAMAGIGGCETGCAVVTGAFGLQTTKHIIHAVGPIYSDYAPERAADLLRSAYENAFLHAHNLGCETVAAPLLSTGVYGYPMEEACAIAVKAAHDFNTKEGQKPLRIVFVAFDDAAFVAVTNAIAKINAQ